MIGLAAAMCVAFTVVQLWSPTRHEATALPGVCPQLPRLPAPSPGPPTPLHQRDADGADCTWGVPGSHEFPVLTAKFWLYHRGTEAAEHEAAQQVTRPQEAGNGRSLGADEPITGVGDEARVTDHGALIVLVARKANVVLTLEYAPHERGAADQNDAASDAKALLDLITVP